MYVMNFAYALDLFKFKVGQWQQTLAKCDDDTWSVQVWWWLKFTWAET